MPAKRNQDQALCLDSVFNDCLQNTLDIKATTTALWKQLPLNPQEVAGGFYERLEKCLFAPEVRIKALTKCSGLRVVYVL